MVSAWHLVLFLTQLTFWPNQELRDEMARELDENQHELAALQDAQRQKMAEISKRHREELAEYEERIEELEEQLQSGEEEHWWILEMKTGHFWTF